MASQELPSRPTCDSTLRMRHFFSHKFHTLVITECEVQTMTLPTTVTIHTSMYVKPEIHTADMKKVIMYHFFQNPLLQSGMVRKSRVMMGRDKTQKIRFRSFSGTANTLLCSAPTQVDKHVIVIY